jgi:hypothetical protein
MNVYKIYREVIYKCNDSDYEMVIYSINMVVIAPNAMVASKMCCGKNRDDKYDFNLSKNEPYNIHYDNDEIMILYYRDIDDNDENYLRTKCKVTLACAAKSSTKMQIIYANEDLIF